LMEDGVATSQTKFITGADGNFYFDLLPPGPDNEYVITIQDPEGRTAKDDTNTQVDTDGSGTLHDVLPLYQQEWHITDDWFYRPDGGYVPVDIPNSPDHPYGSEYYYAAYQNYPDVNFRVYDDGTGTPVHFQDVNGELPSGPDYINFLLAPDASSAANETVVSGQVYADLEGDGAFNNDDAPAAGFIVYADTNHTGMFETTDTYTVTDQTGHYELHIPATVLQGMYIGAEAPSESWQQTAPDGGFLFTYIGAGQGPYEDMDFGFQPVTIPEPPTPPSPEKVSIIGTVFNDSNGNHVRGLGEGGASNFRVYVDSNDNGQLDWTDANGNGLYDEGEGENWAPTAENGAFFLANVDAPDLDPDPNAVLRVVTVRVETDAQWEVTVPVGNAWEVELPLTGTVSGLLFGVHNLATSDYGDLPDSFNYAPDGTYSPPSHVILPGFRLGTHDPDGEIGPQPSPTATGDDAVNDDEDGVQIMTTAVNPNGILLPGSANDGRTVLQVTVAGVGGLLTGWIDFNGDGHFSSDEKLTWKDPEGNLVQEVDLNPGTYQLPIDVPSDVAVGQLGARFRWGPAGLNYYGPASVGEVEDYFFDPPVVQPSQVPDGDFNGDGTVDEGDYNLWKATFHSTTDLRADGNGDGVVDAADYTIWRDHNGEAAGAGASVTTTSHTASSYSSSYDWQYDDGSADVSFEDIDPEFVAYMRSLGFDFRLVRVGLNGSQLMMYRPDVVADGSSTADAALVTDATLETELDWPGVQVGASSTSSPGLVQSPASTSPED
jgi:hypothetical protein